MPDSDRRYSEDDLSENSVPIPIQTFLWKQVR